MLVLVRSNAIVGDPRVEKYVNFLEAEKYEFRIIGWNRTHDKNIAENTIYYDKLTGYSVGGVKAAKDRLFWFFFVVKTLFKLKDVRVIHACDLDCAFPAVLYKLLGHWKVRVIFDVFDWYSATLAGQPAWLRAIFRMMEWITVKCSNDIIICEDERIRQIPYDVANRTKVLPNIPSFGDTSFLKVNDTPYFNNGKITLTYVGGFYEGRFLSELLDIAEEGVYNLLIAGYGDKELEARCEKLSKKDNVIYFGKVAYSQGLNIMYNADVIYAMYCKTNPNHIYAAPNKYYEAMLLGKPIISTKGTIVGEKIESLGIGYTIEENTEELIQLIESLSTESFESCGNKAKELWKVRYKDYVQHFMENEYTKLIK